MSPRILVCDNEEALRDLVRASLNRTGYEIEEARDGDEALSLARRLRPDLVVLDVMMPGQSGLEVLSQLRSDAELDHVKVIILTARAQARPVVGRTRRRGTPSLAKPFSPLVLGIADAAVDEVDDVAQPEAVRRVPMAPPRSEPRASVMYALRPDRAW